MGRPRRRDRLPNTIWEGSFFDTHSLAHCNRAYVLGLLRRNPDWDVSVFHHGKDIVEEPELRSRTYRTPFPLECSVRFQYPPDFRLPPAGHLIAIQPWEYGAIPKDWVENVNHVLTEQWVPSRYVRDCFIDSGCNPDKVHVVPHGVDASLMTPVGDALELTTQKGFKFLFVGGTILRKGADLLLQAYLEEFSRDEDVCLVVKDFGSQTFYQGQGIGQCYRDAAESRSAPEVVYMTDNLAPDQMPALYRSCDALVHPFRGEGYGLPIVEAMSCGLPVIVTNYGSALDFVNGDVAYLIDAERTLTPAESLKSLDLVKAPYWAEPSLEQLRSQMRYVFQHRTEAAKVGQKARQHVLAGHTWDHAFPIVEARLLNLPEKEAASWSFGGLVSALSLDLELRNRFGRDKELVERAMETAPEDPSILATRARAYINDGNWDRGVEIIKEAEAKHPKSLPILAQGAWTFAHKQEESTGYEWALRAIETGEDDFRLRAAAIALYGHYTAIARSPKKFPKKQRQEAEKRAERMKEHLVAGGWDPVCAEPLGTKLTLCMIVKDEEKHLAKCLDSVKGVVDEIVVVDTGSKDCTVEIAKEHGADVFHFAWTNDFSEARNEALKYCTGDWILWLDADEALEENAGRVILEGMIRPQFGGYLMQIINFISDGVSKDVFTHRPCRLFRRLPTVEFTGKIHEQVLASIGDAGLLCANLGGARILHFGYGQQMMADRGKLNRTLELIHKELEDDPDNSFHQFNLGNTLYVAGRMEEAVEAFSQCAENINPKQDFCATAYHLWSSGLVQLRRPEEAIKVVEQADARDVRGPAIEFSRAAALYGLKRYVESLQAVSKARSMEWSDDVTGDFTITTYKLTLIEGQCHFQMDNIPEALRALEACVAEAPHYVPAQYFLGLTYAKMDRSEDSLRCLQHAFTDGQLGDSALMLASEIHLRQGNMLKAAQVSGKLSRRHTEDEQLWSRWLYFAERAQDWPEVNSAYAARAENGNLTADMYVNWGRACATLQEWDKALDHFQGAIETDPSNANALFNAGDTLYKIGAYDEAAEAYQTGLRLDPDNADGWFVLGNALYQLGVYDGAKVALCQALDLRPGYTQAMYNLEVVEGLIRSTAA